MTRHFRDANLKINRAQTHIADLKSRIGILKKSCTSIIEDNSSAGIQELQHLVPNYEDVMADLALITGDAIHNLRTALDYAWYCTIKIHAPSLSRGFSKFPVCATAKKLKDVLKRIKIKKRIPALYKVVVDEFKAYEGGDDFLWTLNELDISDKHLLLFAFVGHASVRDITVEDENGNTVIGSSMLIQSEPPYRFDFKSAWKIKDKGKLSFEVAFKNAGTFKGVQISDMLDIFSVLVPKYVHRLEEL